MNSTTLSIRPGSAARRIAHAPGLRQVWDSVVATLRVVFSVRRQLRQFDEVQGLLREAQQCETTNPTRSAALHVKAFELIN